MNNHAIQKAFEIYHLHGASSVRSMADRFGCTEEHLMSEIAKFGASLTEPYQIKAGDKCIKTVDPVPVLKMVQGSIIEPTRQLNSEFEFKPLKMTVTKE